jgi:hypothetical protein
MAHPTRFECVTFALGGPVFKLRNHRIKAFVHGLSCLPIRKQCFRNRWVSRCSGPPTRTPDRSQSNSPLRAKWAQLHVRRETHPRPKLQATRHSNERVRRLPDRVTCGAPPPRRSHPRSNAPSAPIRAEGTREADRSSGDAAKFPRN